jgi:hypothetical protein
MTTNIKSILFAIAVSGVSACVDAPTGEDVSSEELDDNVSAHESAALEQPEMSPNDHTESLATEDGTSVAAEPRSVTCRVLTNLNPFTMASVSCRKSNILSQAELYAAFVRCIDHRINVQYTNIGPIQTTPAFGGFGPSSTARCDSGDVAIAGGRT